MKIVTVALALSPLVLQAWNRELAMSHLDARQQKWAEWKPAQKTGGPCVSCHTGLPYLFAKQANKQAFSGGGLIDGVKARVLANPEEVMLANKGVDAVLSLLTLSFERTISKSELSDADRAALKRLWAQQQKDGSWTWFSLDLHPVESEHSNYFGTALAAMALAAYPKDDRVEATRRFLRNEAAKQPLHNRLAWIASGDAAKQEKAAVLKELRAAQSPDGGWTSKALGPWKVHDKAPADSGTNAYATAWAAFAAHRSGMSCQQLKPALSWLNKHQDPTTGAWNAVSMNKAFPAESMQIKFMSDAATGYASAVLASCKNLD